MWLVARLGLLSAALAGCGPPAAQPISPRGVSPAPRSTRLGSCVGAEDSLLFAADASMRVVARRVAGGEIAWRAAGAGRVIHCDDEVVLVADPRDGRLTVRVLDAGDGRARREHGVPLPEWAGPEQVDVEGWSERDGWGVAWRAHTAWDGGYPPSPEEERAARRDASDAFVLRPDGTTRPVRGAPEQTPIALPPAIAAQPHAYGTWDGGHAMHADIGGAATIVVRLSDGDPIARLEHVSASVGSLYVAGEGSIVFVFGHDDRPDPDHEYRVHSVRVFGRDGVERWSAELRREEIPAPRP